MNGVDELAVGVGTPLLPVLILAGVAAVFAALRRERVPGLLAAGVIAGAAGLVIGVAVGYPPSDRLMFPLMAGVCVLAGVGAARVVKLGSSQRVRAGLAILLVAASAPFAVARVGDIAATVRAAEGRARLQRDLRVAARLARAKAPRGSVAGVPYDLIWNRGAVAWEWEVPLGEVGEFHHPPRGSPVFTFLPRSRPFAGAGRPVLEARGWRVLETRTFALKPDG